jgi:hypothetical protein
MDDEIIDDTGAPEDDVPLTPRRRFVAGTVMVLVVAGVAFLMVRVSSPPIPPKQAEPQPHWGKQCALCHVVSDAARPIEVKK